MGLLLISFLLWMGPNNWGKIFHQLPLHKEVEVIRYAFLFQYSGMIIIAIVGTILLQDIIKWASQDKASKM